MTAIATDTFDVLDPATGEVIATLDHGDPEAAVAAARAAFPAWARTAPAERAALLKAGARRLREHLEELAELQTREGGKPLDDSRGGVEAGIGAIEQYAELGPLHRGRALQGGWDATDVMVHEPRGVVALLVPWNDPVAIACGQIAAALVTGNAVVFKPSEKTPLTGARIVELLDLPALQLLQGDARVGRPLAAHPDVDLVMHTGSVQTGREIADVVAGRLGKALLELGGKDALIVDEDVDPEWAAEQAALGAFANAGQICTSVERIYVHEAVAEPFIDALEREARRVDDRAADRRAPAGARPRARDRRGAARRRGAVRRRDPGRARASSTRRRCSSAATPTRRCCAKRRSARSRPCRSWPPSTRRWSCADRTEYGLAATVLTKSPAHAQRAARELAVGTVKINAVFGGAPGGAAEPARLSGSGFGYGPELLDELTRTKVVHMGIAP